MFVFNMCLKGLMDLKHNTKIYNVDLKVML